MMPRLQRFRQYICIVGSIANEYRTSMRSYNRDKMRTNATYLNLLAVMPI